MDYSFTEDDNEELSDLTKEQSRARPLYREIYREISKLAHVLCDDMIV